MIPYDVSVNKRKFSISMVKDKRKSLFRKDPKYEFDAPKFFDFSKEEQEEKQNEDYIDPFFFINHSKKHLKINPNFQANKRNTINNSRSSNRNSVSIREMIKLHNEKLKKRKYSQFQNENSLIQREETGNSKSANNIYVYQSKKKKISDRSKNSDLKSNIIQLEKTNSSSISVSSNKISQVSNRITKYEKRINRFESDAVNNISKTQLRRNHTTSTIQNSTHPNKHLNHVNKTQKNQPRKVISAKVTTYCPRVHKAHVMKKWEAMKGKNWYGLSPESRSEANKEISEMVKKKLL